MASECDESEDHGCSSSINTIQQQLHGLRSDLKNLQAAQDPAANFLLGWWLGPVQALADPLWQAAEVVLPPVSDKIPFCNVIAGVSLELVKTAAHVAHSVGVDLGLVLFEEQWQRKLILPEAPEKKEKEAGDDEFDQTTLLGLLLCVDLLPPGTKQRVLDVLGAEARDEKYASKSVSLSLQHNIVRSVSGDQLLEVLVMLLVYLRLRAKEFHDAAVVGNMIKLLVWLQIAAFIVGTLVMTALLAWLCFGRGLMGEQDEMVPVRDVSHVESQAI